MLVGLSIQHVMKWLVRDSIVVHVAVIHQRVEDDSIDGWITSVDRQMDNEDPSSDGFERALILRWVTKHYD